MYNISPREREHNFFETSSSQIRSNLIRGLRIHKGLKQPTFCDIRWALGLLLYDSKQLRCMEDAFSSSLDLFTELFSIIMAFCRTLNPLRILERTKELMICDFRRRHFGTDLDDEIANDNVLNEIQDSLTKISTSLTLEPFYLQVP